METHLEMRAAELRRQGLDADAARAAARREFGGIEQMKEAYRDRRGIPWIESLAKDARYGLRGLRAQSRFHGRRRALAGVGNRREYRHLLVHERADAAPAAGRKAGATRVISTAPAAGAKATLRIRSIWSSASIPICSRAYSRAAPPTKCASPRGPGNSVEYAQREYVTGNYFDVLGVKPAMGRLFTDDDNRMPQGHPLVVLSYDFWRNRMAQDPAVLGRVLRVDEQPLTVIGVAAPGFHGVEVENRADLWVPAMMFRGQIMQPGMHWIWIMARCRPEIPRGRIQAAANTIMQQYLMSVYGAQRELGVRQVGVGAENRSSRRGRRHLHAPRRVRQAIDHPDGGGRPGAADRLRQCR